MRDFIRAAVAESIELKKDFFLAHEQTIAQIAQEICSSLDRGNKVLLFGNGGSAADAQHIAAEWIGRFNKDRRAIPAIALTTDTSILTAVANDYGFDQIFARQIQGLGRKGDIAIALSTSGNSLNVLLAAEAALKMGLITVGLTGRDGGGLGAKVKYHLNVPHDLSARIQEVHIMVGHILCGLVENNVKGL